MINGGLYPFRNEHGISMINTTLSLHKQIMKLVISANHEIQVRLKCLFLNNYHRSPNLTSKESHKSKDPNILAIWKARIDQKKLIFAIVLFKARERSKWPHNSLKRFTILKGLSQSVQIKWNTKMCTIHNSTERNQTTIQKSKFLIKTSNTHVNSAILALTALSKLRGI